MREKELDGSAYYKLRPRGRGAGRQISPGRRASTVAWLRAYCIGDSSKQYPYAARDLQSCIRLSSHIADEADIEKHATFVARLQQSHGRKHGFWGLVKP